MRWSGWSLKSKIAGLRRQLAEMGTREPGRNRFLAAVRKFMQMDTLTAPLLRELIDRIDVYEKQQSRHRQGVSVEYLRSPVTS